MSGAASTSRRRKLDVVAHELSQQRQSEVLNPTTDWAEAEQICLKEQTSRIENIAYAIWEKLGWPEGTRERDWHEAEQIARWENWAEAKLRPYLAIRAKSEPNGTAKMLEGQFPSAGKMVLIACLDGSPEFSRHWYTTYQKAANGTPLEAKIDGKDAAFYRLCRETLSYLMAKVAAPESRLFQDSCLALFETGRLHDTLLAAFSLRNVLNEFNDSKNLRWEDRFHARLAIGPNWSSSIRCLPFSRRDDIVIDHHSLMALEPDAMKQRLLLEGAGLKVAWLKEAFKCP